MKIKYNKPKYGQKRTTKKFMWFPKYINKNIVWLEYVKVEQYYICDLFFYIPMWESTKYEVVK